MPACFVVLRKVPLVALRKESVDRNIVGFPGVLGWLGSLSARRAWIEILCPLLMFCPFPVALRKESVDRNNGIPYSAAIRRASLSARRAWIEIVNCQAMQANS